MALINCYECGKEISDQATACPHCGAPVKKNIKEQIDDKQISKSETKADSINTEESNIRTPSSEPLSDTTSVVIGWVTGVFLVFMALGSLTDGDIAASLICLLGAAFLLPPIRKKVYQKTQVIIPSAYRIGIVIGALVFAMIASQSAEASRAEEAKQKLAEEKAAIEIAKKEQELKEFKTNKEKILQSIAHQIENKSFKDALQTCNIYMKFGDKDLTPLCMTVKTEVVKIEQKEKAERAKKEAAEAAKAKAREEAKLKASMGSKAWKLHKKHPEWSIDDCKYVAEHRYWIGMSYDMLKASRGLPDSANPSNFGNGTRWQWCWHDYAPSCFYDENDDGIIDSYN